MREELPWQEDDEALDELDRVDVPDQDDTADEEPAISN